ncbi:hypothetical protein Ancab_009878 [Ancistrocladus abbreviatus]
MGNSEAEKPVKSEKRTSPVKEQGNVHVYPDWAAVQAYYGAGAVPHPYFNPAVASGHAAHPYMWASPQMMPPYGSPYAALYPHGIYGHAAPMVATPLSIETPTRSGNDSSSGKKLKESDGHATAGNGNAESAGEVGTQGHSQSTDSGTEGSCDRSDDSTAREEQNGRKRSYNGVTESGKHGSQKNACPGGEANRGNAVAPGNGLPCATSAGSRPASALGTNGSSIAKANATAVNAAALGASKPSDISKQDERELKREKRKQSNRESARRSRLRKQAETEELAKKVESLVVENMALRSEINKLAEDMEKLRSENAALMEKLKNVQVQVDKTVVSDRTDDQGMKNVNTENLLSRVNNSVSNDAHEQEAVDK